MKKMFAVVGLFCRRIARPGCLRPSGYAHGCAQASRHTATGRARGNHCADQAGPDRYGHQAAAPPGATRIEWWHAMSGANGDAVGAIADGFNKSQTKCFTSGHLSRLV